MIFGKNYNSLTPQDFERLVSNKIPESRTLDYKRDLNLEKGDDRKDFLYDIASFANTDGGTIIYGISECKDSLGQNTGIPDSITGSNLENSDKTIQKIEDLIKSYIEPNIPNITIRAIEINGKKVLFIGIPKPFGLPRMVTYNDSNKFYKRRNTGKYLLDVYELNQLFMSNFELIKQVEDFRKNRISEVLTLKFLENIDASKVTFIHIVPLSFYVYNQLSFLDESLINKIKLKLGPIGTGSWDSRYNFEGLLLFSRDYERGFFDNFTQVFRNGIIEYFTHAFHGSNMVERKTILLGWLEISVIEKIQNVLEFYKEANVQPPFVIQLTICDLNGRFVDIRDFYNIDYNPFISDRILVPNILINDYDVDVSRILKTTFDIIWQSAGIKKSPFYNTAGERIKK